jgi:predicted nucleic acid-binding protein
MTTVFIDTNVLLSFYAFTSDDLSQLEKVVAEMKAGKLPLFITDQVRDELKRNREAKIAEALKGFPDKAGVAGIPNMVRHLPEYEALQGAADNYIKLKKEIVKKIEAEIKDRALPADKVISDILNAAKIVGTSGEVIAAAEHRMSVGRPPGKNGSLGDAINWELLLRNANAKSDLYIVTRDRDFVSQVSDERFSEYLADEWQERVGGHVHFFSNVRDLFKGIGSGVNLSVAANTAISAGSSRLKLETYAPSVRVSEEIDQHIEASVEALEKSGSYARTHRSIAQIRLKYLSPDQAARLFRAAVENQEIYGISEDDDVQEFFRALLKTFPDQLEGDIKGQFLKLFS